MNKRQITPDMKNCAHCYWFRPYSWHVGTAQPVKASSRYMNRGCTYGWQKRVEQQMPPLSQAVERFMVEGDMLSKPVCSGWKDCGAYDAGVKKASVVGIDQDKARYMQWLNEQGIPYEE